MASKDSLVQECEYYVCKSQQHLARTKLCRDLATESVVDHRSGTSGSAVSADVAELIRKSVGDDASELSEKLIRAPRESHFLALTVNFEFFLYRMVACNWTYRFFTIANGKPGLWRKSEVRLADIARSAAVGCNANNFVIERAVVSQSLDTLISQSKKLASINIHGIIVGAHYRDWAEIHTAFEIRHLFEHGKGRTDRRFLDDNDLRKDWKNSSGRT